MTTSSKAATRDKLEELHKAVCDVLIAVFSGGQKCPACGHPDVSATWLDNARRFLKDNGIQADGASLADMKRNLEELRGLDVPFPRKDKEEDESED